MMRLLFRICVVWCSLTLVLVEGSGTTVLRSDSYDPDDPDIAYLYDYFERLFTALYDNAEHREWYSGSPTGESWAERNCDLQYDFLYWTNSDYLKGDLEQPVFKVDATRTPPFNLREFRLRNTKATGVLESWMIEDISSSAHPFLIGDFGMNDRIRLSGNVADFFEGFSEAPMLSLLDIVDEYKGIESEDWQGLTGSIPDAITTWTQLHSLYIQDQDLQGQLPMKLSTYYMPELNTLGFRNNPNLCGSRPFGGGGRLNFFEGTLIGIKQWDASTQQCIDPPPPPPPESPLAPPPPPMIVNPPPDPTLPPAPAQTPEISPIYAPYQLTSPIEEPAAEISPIEEPAIEISPVLSSAVSPVIIPSSVEVPSPAEVSLVIASAVPMQTPSLAPIMAEFVCSRSTPIASIAAPVLTNRRSFVAVITFQTEDDFFIFCEDLSCEIGTSEGVRISPESLKQLDGMTYSFEVETDHDGEVQLWLTPRDLVLEACNKAEFDSPIWTTIVDTHSPRLEALVISSPTERTPNCELELVFDEPVQGFIVSSVVLVHATLLSFHGNGTHFYVGFKGDHGNNASVLVPAIGYSDRAGNYGNEDFELSIWIPETPKSFIQQSSSVAVLGTFAATTAISLTSAVSSGSSASGGGNFVRAIGHTQFLAMCTTLAVPHLPQDFLQLCNGYKWSLLTGDDNSTYTESSIADTPTTSRKLLKLRLGAKRGLKEEVGAGTDQNAVMNRSRIAQVVDASTEIHVTRKSRIEWDFLVSKMISSLCIYITCCFLHTFTVKLIRLFKPNATLPFILTFPKPQVALATMLVPPLVYIAAMVSTSQDHFAPRLVLVLLPIPCTLYLLYAAFPSATPHRNRISTLDYATTESSSQFSEEELLGWTKASLSILGTAPTLILEDDDDSTEDSDSIEEGDSTEEESSIEREELDNTIAAPRRRRATRWQRKSTIPTPQPIAEGRETTPKLTSQPSDETPFLDNASPLETPSNSVRKERRLLDVYGPLFDDVIGEEGMELSKKVSNLRLLCLLLHFVTRVISAALFGLFHTQDTSSLQVQLLLGLHSCLFLYLVLQRPYANKVLMLVEILCTLCEVGILLLAMVILETQNHITLTSHSLMTLSYLDIGILISYEFFRIGKYVKRALNTSQNMNSMSSEIIVVKTE